MPLVWMPWTRPKYCSAMTRSFSADVCPGSSASPGVAAGSSCSSITDRKLTFSLYRVTSAAGSSSSLCKASASAGSATVSRSTRKSSERGSLFKEHTSTQTGLTFLASTFVFAFQASWNAGCEGGIQIGRADSSVTRQYCTCECTKSQEGAGRCFAVAQAWHKQHVSHLFPQAGNKSTFLSLLPF